MLHGENGIGDISVPFFFISLAIASFNHLLILFMLVIRVTLCLWLSFFFFRV